MPPVLHASLPPGHSLWTVQIERSSVQACQSVVQYGGPAQFAQQAIPTAAVRAPTMPLLRQKQIGVPRTSHGTPLNLP
jgi:hypothetical protein